MCVCVHALTCVSLSAFVSAHFPLFCTILKFLFINSPFYFINLYPLHHGPPPFAVLGESMNLIFILPKWFLSHSWLNVKACILPVAQKGPCPLYSYKVFSFPWWGLWNLTVWLWKAGMLEKRLCSLVSGMLSGHVVRMHHTRTICSLMGNTENSSAFKISTLLLRYIPKTYAAASLHGPSKSLTCSNYAF